MKKLSFIDLFCGCGGFSLGMERSGFQCLAAVDFNPEAMKVFRANFPGITHALEKDLTSFEPGSLAELIGTNDVDVIVGGPPCQGFSHVRQRDGSNSGPRMVDDKRRHLYREFLKYVGFFLPKVFVMENVLGIKSAAGGKYFTQVQKEARQLGYRVHPKVEKAFDLGVPQKRYRQLIIGTRLDFPDFFAGDLQPVARAIDHPTLWDAIGDLPPLQAGGGEELAAYDMERRKAHVSRYGRRYLYEVLEVQKATRLTAHTARPHSERDLGDFEKLCEGESSAVAMRRGVKFDFPYDKENFQDRYTRQHRNEPCSTIVAHLSKDGLMFIHPTQNRSLTPREAARVQSFPDGFQFPVSRTHQFRAIGNAVPPLVAEAVGEAVKAYLDKSGNAEKVARGALAPLPADHQEALEWLCPLLKNTPRALKRTTADEFKRGWYSIGFLYPGLHPDSSLDHGKETSSESEDHPFVRSFEPKLIAPYYARSGWPVVLAPIAAEAWRRFDAGEMKHVEFYCGEAVMAGMSHRDAEPEAEMKRERVRAFA
jgi:DNA (cytosine-5)-methyltransferase 1